MTSARPKLLISVRDGEEARAAINGGCDWLDVKEPNRGSLGFAGIDRIEDVVSVRNSLSPQMPISAALGEFRDWNDLAIIPQLPTEITLVKMGLAGSGRDWKQDWAAVRREFQRQNANRLRWVPVVYVDPGSGSPSLEDYQSATIDDAAGFVLFDTYRKNGGNARSLQVGDSVAGWEIVWAGQITPEIIAIAAGRLPAMIAVRSAVCTGADRRNPVEERLVASFRAALDEIAAAEDPENAVVV